MANKVSIYKHCTHVLVCIRKGFEILAVQKFSYKQLAFHMRIGEAIVEQWHPKRVWEQ